MPVLSDIELSCSFCSSGMSNRSLDIIVISQLELLIRYLTLTNLAEVTCSLPVHQ